MRTIIITLFFSFFVVSTNVICQERVKFLTFDAGADFTDASMANLNYIRADWYDVYGYGDSFLYGTRSILSRNYATVKIEVRNRKDIVGFIAGIRYSRVNGSIEKNSSPDFFFFRLRENGLETEYLKVAELSQSSDYIGIPLELRVFTMRPRQVRLYFMAGTDINLRVNTKNDARFDNAAMRVYADDVSAIVGKPDDWYATFYGRAGLTFGKEKPLFGIAITFPVVMTNSASSLVNGGLGGGFNFQIQKKF